jgi:hypothetical protein
MRSLTGPVGVHARWRRLPIIRAFVALGRERLLRVIAAVALVVGMMWVISNAMPIPSDLTRWINDSGNYYAAGERLNAGHSLYAYGPGDRHELDLLFGLPSPYLYPPLIGVLFRPIAAGLPYGPAVVAFWFVGMVSFLVFLGWLLLRGSEWTSVGVLVLLVPLVETAWSGNVSTYLLILLVASWLALQTGREKVAGAAIGFATVIKLTPAFLVWWLFVTHRRAGLRVAILVGLAGLAIGLVGSSVADHATYLTVSNAAARGGGIEGSIVGILHSLGASPDVLPFVAPIVSLVGVAAIWRYRDHERVAWALAITTGVFASPIFNLTNVTLLLAAFVAMDPHFSSTGRTRESAGSGGPALATEEPSSLVPGTA